MIVIMTEQEKAISNLLMGTFAQQMITDSNIPVVSVRPEQINGAAK